MARALRRCAQEAGDDEAEEEEAQEALRLQREAAAALRPEDFDQEGGGEEEEEEEEEEEGEETLGAAAARGAARGAVVEQVARDLRGLSAAEQAAAVLSDAPELTTLAGACARARQPGACGSFDLRTHAERQAPPPLAGELAATLAEVRTRAAPLAAAVRGGEYATAEGVSYLEAKHLLLLSYWCRPLRPPAAAARPLRASAAAAAPLRAASTSCFTYSSKRRENRCATTRC